MRGRGGSRKYRGRCGLGDRRPARGARCPARHDGVRTGPSRLRHHRGSGQHAHRYRPGQGNGVELRGTAGRTARGSGRSRARTRSRLGQARACDGRVASADLRAFEAWEACAVRWSTAAGRMPPAPPRRGRGNAERIAICAQLGIEPGGLPDRQVAVSAELTRPSARGARGEPRAIPPK